MNKYSDLYEYDDEDSGMGCLESLLTFVAVTIVNIGIVVLLLKLFTGK